MLGQIGTDWWCNSRVPVLHLQQGENECRIYFDPADRTALCPMCRMHVGVVTLHGSFGQVPTRTKNRVRQRMVLYPAASTRYDPCGCTYYPHTQVQRSPWRAL